MRIEQPEHTLGAVAQAGGVSGDVGDVGGALTIGQFYRRIRATLVALGEGAFSGRRHHQVTSAIVPEAIAVTGVKSATVAIDTIIDQGEGTLSSPLEVVGTDVAHYYRFAEVVHGRKLVRNPDAGPGTPPGERYVYAGDPVPADEAAVRAAPVNPTLAGYPAASPAALACTAFNYTYTSVLKTLHATFNGTPGELTAAVGLMASLQQQATDMMSAALPAGPSFEWQPSQ
jgi:hypothetical protein